MIKHRRWYCPNCSREWIEPSTGMYVNSAPLTITGNKRNDLCPICGGPDIRFVEYTPKFLGGDYQESELPIGISLKDIGEDVTPLRPQTIGFVQNNLISMLTEEKK